MRLQTSIRTALRAITLVLVATMASACKNRADSMEGSRAGEGRYFNIAQGADIEFRWVPAGTYIMGSPTHEQGRSPGEAEKPVKIVKGFWIATHETTMAVWQKVMGTPARLKPTAMQIPVARISWHDCRQFLSRLQSPAPGWRYELPSETEWEYACRAGTRTPFALAPADAGWIGMNSSGRRHPVGGKTPNFWHICDMHGNVAEWCRDRVGERGEEAAIRGGSWESDFNARSAARNSDTPHLRINRVGFRLVLVRDETVDTTPDAKPSVSQITHTRLP